MSELGTSTCAGPVVSRRSSGELGRGTFRATAGRVSPSSSINTDSVPGGYDDSGTAMIRCPGVGGAMLELVFTTLGDGAQVLSGVADRTLCDLPTGLASGAAVT